MCAKLRTVAASNNRVHAPRSLYYCLFAPHRQTILVYFTWPTKRPGGHQSQLTINIGVVLAHIPFVVNHTFNATPVERLQQHPLLFTTNRTDRTFFLCVHTARPPHPGHSTILLPSESPSGMCAKLCTVAASNNRVHGQRSLYYCLFAPHIYRCCSRAHLVRGESHIQHNTSGEVATLQLNSPISSQIKNALAVSHRKRPSH